MPNATNSELSERDLLRVELPEQRYRADVILFDHGQGLSAEMLKLALAGIAVVGFLLPLLPKSASTSDRAFKLLLASSVIAFALSTAAALLQRFYASSGMFHHIKAMKLAFHNNPALDDATDSELRTRLTQFRLAHTLLKATAFLLSTGAVLLAGAFIRLMLFL